MKRSSPYHPLKWRVDWSTGHYWETIAAFNSETIALKYAADCRKGYQGSPNPPAYRTMIRTAKGWKTID